MQSGCMTCAVASGLLHCSMRDARCFLCGGRLGGCHGRVFICIPLLDSVMNVFGADVHALGLWSKFESLNEWSCTCVGNY